MVGTTQLMKFLASSSIATKRDERWPRPDHASCLRGTARSGRRGACGGVDARITGNLPIFFAVEVHARLEADHVHGRVMVRP